MPRRTSLMSAPMRSHKLAISLIKLIFIASMALATYLVISADSGDITKNGCSVRRYGAYSSCSTPPTPAPRPPNTTRTRRAGAPGWAPGDGNGIGAHEVVDGGPLLEELRIARHVDRLRRTLRQTLAE